MFGAGKMPADRETMSAQPGQNGEHVRVGGVVTAENDLAARKGFLFGQGAHRGAFIHADGPGLDHRLAVEDRKSTRLNSSHMSISYAVFCLKKKKTNET